MSRLASSETAPVPYMVLWRVGPSPHPATPSIASSTRLILVESSNKELGQVASTLARAQSDDLFAFSMVASLATREASSLQISLA